MEHPKYVISVKEGNKDWIGHPFFTRRDAWDFYQDIVKKPNIQVIVYGYNEALKDYKELTW